MKAGVRERLGEPDQRAAGPAAHVGHQDALLELLLEALDLGHPCLHERMVKACARRALQAGPEVLAVLLDRDAATVAEGVLHPVGRLGHAAHQLSCAGHIRRRRLLCQHKRVLERELEALRAGVVVDIARRRHGGAPLAHVALAASAAGGQARRSWPDRRPQARARGRAGRRSTRAWRRGRRTGRRSRDGRIRRRAPRRRRGRCL